MQKEKNIHVRSGIPRTPSSSGSGGMFIGGSGAAINADLGSDGYDIAESLLVDNNAYTENKYNEDVNNIAQIVEAELAQIRAANLATGAPTADAITQELNALNTLLSQKTTEHQEQTTVANLFYGHDPLTHQGGHPSEKGFDVPPRLSQKDFRRAVEKWNVSFAAAYRAKLLIAQINIIENKVADQVRAAAEAEAAAIAKAAAEAEAAAIAKAKQAISVVNTFGAQLSTAAGSIALTPGSTLTLDLAVERAIALLKSLKDAATVETAAGIAARWIPFAALFYTSSLGNSDLYPPNQFPIALTLPAKTLAPDLAQNLSEIAAAGGTIDVPYRIYGDHAKYSLIATQADGGVSLKVPVRALTLDPAANAYTFTTTDTPPRTLIFPIATPATSTSTTPAVPVETPVYTGVTLTPVKVEAEALPAIDQLDIRDCIYCFPADSGLPPIYAVFSSPYEGATTKGKHSGRMYNPEQAGGPTQDLDWTTASVTPEGIDLVKLHTGRFPPSDANKIMIDRLERILRGEMPINNIDKRFYTHEIKELERYRALGVADGVEPNDDGTIWNNAHAATLEDYKLKDAFDLFYTPEAIEADFEQTVRENK